MTTETQPFTARQSHLATFIRCPLSARYSLEVEAAGDFHSPEQARGVMAHRCKPEILRRMKSDGERRIGHRRRAGGGRRGHGPGGPRSRRAAGPRPRAEGRGPHGAVGFARWPWDVRRIVAIERRLFSTLTRPRWRRPRLHGPARRDARDAARRRRDPGLEVGVGSAEGAAHRSEHQHEKRYLSERGHYQLDGYGVLVMDNYPAIQRVRLDRAPPDGGRGARGDARARRVRRGEAPAGRGPYALRPRATTSPGRGRGVGSVAADRRALVLVVLWPDALPAASGGPPRGRDHGPPDGRAVRAGLGEGGRRSARTSRRREGVGGRAWRYPDAGRPHAGVARAEKDGKVSRRFKAAVPSENGTGEA
jgi:hypothetical protein